MMLRARTRLSSLIILRNSETHLPVCVRDIDESLHTRNAYRRMFTTGEKGTSSSPSIDLLSSSESRKYWHQWHLDVLKKGSKTFEYDFELPSDLLQMKNLIKAIVKMNGNVGDFVPDVVIQSLCSAYDQLDDDEKASFFTILGQDLNTDSAQIDQAIESYTAKRQQREIHLSTQRRALRESLRPIHELLFQQIISRHQNGMLVLIQMREDVRKLMSMTSIVDEKKTTWKEVEYNLKTLLISWFSVGFLHLQRFTFEHSSGSMLDKLCQYEAVHPVKTLRELKRRLGHGRRCFGFFHPSIPNEPLVFVHVALVEGLADSMKYINDSTGSAQNERQADTAIFYSISSTQPGLQGIDLGNFLIKQVAKQLLQESHAFPNLTTFSTLSPIPGFRSWMDTLSSTTMDECMSADAKAKIIQAQFLRSPKNHHEAQTTPAAALRLILNDPAWSTEASTLELLEPGMMQLAAHYLIRMKKRGKALCPVGNFHVRNGAILERINWFADPSVKGLSQSAGIMVNYKYVLEDVEKNNENYVLKNDIALGKSAAELLLKT